jgi:hypothetical protein
MNFERQDYWGERKVGQNDDLRDFQLGLLNGSQGQYPHERSPDDAMLQAFVPPTFLRASAQRASDAKGNYKLLLLDKFEKYIKLGSPEQQLIS